MKIHLAVSTKNISESIVEYTEILGCSPDLIINNEYALWRTDNLNLSIRKSDENAGVVRHVGFEDDRFEKFEIKTDKNGLTWEYFNKFHQAEEIKSVWPNTIYLPK